MLGGNSLPQKFCPGCDQLLSTDLFGKQSTSKDGLRRICKSCRHDEYMSGREQALQKQHDRYHARSSEDRRELLDRENDRRNKRSIIEIQSGNCSKCLARPAEVGALCNRCYTYSLQRNRQLTKQVVESYGGACCICGETEQVFLSIDHIGNDGADHRRNIGNGYHFYRWLRKNRYPDGYQVLCHNHNWLKYLNTLSNDQTYIKVWRAAIRQEVLTAYGNVCVCCGEERQQVLTIDHIDGGGNNHRRSIGYSGFPFYAWLRKNNFPEGFQILCFNCNRAKFYSGGCPHQM